MAIIGTFAATKDGGWSGVIRTLSLDVKVRFVPNDNQANEAASAFRVFAGNSEIGAAWRKKTSGDQPRDYLSVSLDDPMLPKPIWAAMFKTAGTNEFKLVWSRRA